MPAILDDTRIGDILRITSVEYPSINKCAKFVLNGCLNENGTREQDCDSIKKPLSWENYKGIAAERQCLDPECLCRGPNFDISVGVAYNAII